MTNHQDMKIFISMLLIAGFATVLIAEEERGGIYRSKDRQGNTVFTDRPGEDAERVDLREPNVTPAVKPRPRTEKKAAKDSEAAYEVVILSPADRAIVPNGRLPTQVSVEVNPPLLPRHSVEYLLDGKSLGILAGQQYTIDRLTPGAHEITVQVVDRDGAPVGRSDSVTITAYWPGRN